MAEPVLYTLSQVKKRWMIPKTLILLLLSMVFYIGVMINLWLIDLVDSTAQIIKIITLIILALLVLVETGLNYHKTKQNYYFYQNRIVFQNQSILLSEIKDIQLKENWLDKVFNTKSVILNNQFKINNISNSVELKEYIQKLVAYSKNN